MTTATRTRLRNIAEIRSFFRTNEQSIYFVGPTGFNLLGLDRWVRNFNYVMVQQMLATTMDRARASSRQRREHPHVLPSVARARIRIRIRGIEEAAPLSVSAGQDRFSDVYPRPDSNRRYRLERAASWATRRRGREAVETLAESENPTKSLGY